MPNIKKTIYNQIAEDLMSRAKDCDNKILKAKYNLKQLAEELRDLKKKRSELYRLNAEFTGKIKNA